MKKVMSLGAVTVVVLLATLAASPVYGDPGGGGGGQGLERAKAAQEKHTKSLMANPNIVGTAVGYSTQGEAVVKVYIKNPNVKVPEKLEEVPVEKVVTGMIVALACPPTAGRCDRPVPIGVSTGHPDITAGTVGARVTNGTNVFALSNNHVYANENLAGIGDNVLQPGPYDGGTDPNDAIGTLHAFQPIDFSGGNNTIDAAIALSSTENLGDSTSSDGYGMPSSAIFGDSNGDGVFDDKNDLLSLNVQKYGRTTQLTSGQVIDINVTVNVCYEVWLIFCTKSALFVDQIGVSPGTFSAGGDSGSLIVTNDVNKNPVGLLFAGSETRTFANRIDLVLSEFGVTIDGGGPPPPSDTTAPTVTGVTPAEGTVDVAVNTNVLVTFSEGVNGVASTTFRLNAGGADIASSITVADDRLSATFDPDADLAEDTLHTVTVTTGVTDDSGNPMSANFTSSFTTDAPPSDTTGPVTNGVVATPNPTDGASTVTLTATVDDLTTGASAIAAAEYFIDAVGANESGTAMSAADGAFGSISEGVTASVDVSGLSLGPHTLYVHGKDAAGNWGTTNFVELTVSAPYYGDAFQGVQFHPFTTDPTNIACVASTKLANNRDCDPVNLFFPGKTWAEVRDDLITAEWSSGTGSTQQVYFYDATLEIFVGQSQDTQLVLQDGSSRYHVRLYQVPAAQPPLTLAAAHHEDVLHTIDMDWDQAEASVAGQLCDPPCLPSEYLGQQDEIQGNDGIWRSWLNDVYATVISGSPPPPPDTTPPDAPTGLTAADRPNDAGAIDLTWTPSTSGDVTEQRLYRGTSSGSYPTLVATFAGNTTSSHTDAGLTNGQTYYYVVRAFDGTNESVNSNEASAAPTDNTPPPPEVTVTSCSPNSAPPNGWFTVTVGGSGFQDGATVDFGGGIIIKGVVAVNPDATQLQAQMRVHKKADPGPRDVTVINPDGSSGTGTGCFTVNGS